MVIGMKKLFVQILMRRQAYVHVLLRFALASNCVVGKLFYDRDDFFDQSTLQPELKTL